MLLGLHDGMVWCMYANASISLMVKLYLESCHSYLYTVADNIFTTAVILI